MTRTDESSHRVAQFIRFLRTEGYDVGPRETEHALAVLGERAALDVTHVRAATRALCCCNQTDWRRYDEVFNRFWLPELVPQRESAAARVDPRLANRGGSSGGMTGLAGSSDFQEPDQQFAGAGRQRTLAKADFRFLTDRRGQREVETLATRLALRIRRRAHRRRRDAHRGHVINMRRTMRRSLATAAEPMHLSFASRRLELPRLVLLQDVSHSMAGYTPLLTRFTRGLLRVFPRSEAFVFHTELYRVTHLYREADPVTLRKRLEHYQHLWLGGTQIGESLALFLQRFASRHLDRRTLVVILSDGFDSDEPDYLEQQLVAMRERVRRVIWVNPMLGRRTPEEEPDGDITRGLAALVDHVGPGHSLDGLAETVDYLCRC